MQVAISATYSPQTYNFTMWILLVPSHSSLFMPPSPLDAGGSMFSDCPFVLLTVRPSVRAPAHETMWRQYKLIRRWETRTWHRSILLLSCV